MNNYFWGKLLDILTDGKHPFFTFAVALSSFIIYYFGLVPQYNRYLVACCVAFSLLSFVQIVIIFFGWIENIILKHRRVELKHRIVESLVNDSYCFNVLSDLYKSNGNPLDLDNRNGKVISLLNAGLIYKVRELPQQIHYGMDQVDHEYSSYNITSLGKKLFDTKNRK